MAETVVGEDRISELPVHIIHKILRQVRCSSGLKQEARTCVLSKTWNLIWRTRPDMILEYFDNYRNLDDFVKFVDDSLRPHVEQNLRIEMLCFRQLDPEELPCQTHVDRWVELAVKLGVKFVAIEASWFRSDFYSIPDSIYAAKTLIGLYLSGCTFTDNKLQRLMGTCSLIRDLKLSSCMGFKNLRVSGLVNLEYLELSMCKELGKIEIWAPNLKRFVYVGVPLKVYPWTLEPEVFPCTIDILDGHKTLQHLSLENTTMTDQQFEHKLSMFTALEDLRLDGYHVMKNIKVVSGKLKEFRLWRWRNLEQVNMVAPNLMTFYFQGPKMPLSITSIDLSNVERGRLDFYLQPSDSYNFGDVDRIWKVVVRNLDCCNRLKLVFHCEESILIYEVVLSPDLNPMMPLESFVNDMLFAQPKIIFVVHGIDSKILQVFHEMTGKMQNTRLKQVTNHKGASWLKSNSLITTFSFKWE